MKLQAFNITGSVEDCFQLQAVLAKIQDFAMNGSDNFCDGVCFYFNAVVVCFQ